jgi:hypothetical protein
MDSLPQAVHCLELFGVVLPSRDVLMPIFGHAVSSLFDVFQEGRKQRQNQSCPSRCSAPLGLFLKGYLGSG